MAAIFKRISKYGVESWRVQFRRKGIKQFSLEFSTKKEATDFAQIHESEFIKDPEKYFAFEKESRLSRRREREFNS